MIDICLTYNWLYDWPTLNLLIFFLVIPPSRPSRKRHDIDIGKFGFHPTAAKVPGLHWAQRSRCGGQGHLEVCEKSPWYPYLYLCLYLYLYLYNSISIFLYHTSISLYVSIYPRIHPSILPSIQLSIHPSLPRSLPPSVHPSVHLMMVNKMPVYLTFQWKFMWFEGTFQLENALENTSISIDVLELLLNRTASNYQWT